MSQRRQWWQVVESFPVPSEFDKSFIMDINVPEGCKLSFEATEDGGYPYFLNVVQFVTESDAEYQKRLELEAEEAEYIELIKVAGEERNKKRIIELEEKYSYFVKKHKQQAYYWDSLGKPVERPQGFHSISGMLAAIDRDVFNTLKEKP